MNGINQTMPSAKPKPWGGWWVLCLCHRAGVCSERLAGPGAEAPREGEVSLSAGRCSRWRRRLWPGTRGEPEGRRTDRQGTCSSEASQTETQNQISTWNLAGVLPRSSVQPAHPENALQPRSQMASCVVPALQDRHGYTRVQAPSQP